MLDPIVIVRSDAAQWEEAGKKETQRRGGAGKMGRKHFVSYEGVLLKHPNRIHDYRLGNIGRRGQS